MARYLLPAGPESGPGRAAGMLWAGWNMFISSLINRGALPVLEKMAAFTEARHQVLAENIANADTPRYRAKHLDARAFQQALRRAIERRGGSNAAAPLEIRSTRQFGMDRDGDLWTKPTEEPLENLMFHDGTTMRIERQMSQLAENHLMHQLATQLLRGRFESLLKAIRGRIA